tara:strand:+ start:40001 stop:41200 length:1200 start_codon:yes stop_codon:yes gene_type:complete
VLAIASTACSSQDAAPILEDCPLSKEESTERPPIFEAEKIYNVPIRTPASDPINGGGVHSMFLDESGVASFTTTSYVRASLDGELLSTLPYRGIYTVKQADGVYGAAIASAENVAQGEFCLFSQDGTLASCQPALGREFAWRTPNFYFPFVENRQHPGGPLEFVEVSKEGVVGTRHQILPGEIFKHGAIRVLATDAGFLLDQDNRTPEEDPECETSETTHLSVELQAQTAWASTVPLGYSTARVRNGYTASSPNVIVSVRGARICRESITANTCAYRNEGVAVVNFNNLATGEQTLRYGEQYYADSVTWDGRYFVLYQIAENGISIATFTTETGEIVGIATWEEGSFVQFSPGKIAAAAPGDYIINYSINGLEPQDRLGRVRITLPDEPMPNSANSAKL